MNALINSRQYVNDSRQDTQKLLVVDRRYVDLLGGDLQAGIFLDKLVFYCQTPTAQSRDGWCYQTLGDWEGHYLTRRDTERARKKLKEMGIIEEKTEGVPPKIHYRIDYDRLAQLLISLETSDDTSCQILQNELSDVSRYSMSLNSAFNQNLKNPPLYSPQRGEVAKGSGQSRKTSKEETDAFKRWYACYPRKEARGSAWRAWVKNGCEEIAEEVISKTKAHRFQHMQPKNGEDFRSMPASFLNARRWEDDPAPPAIDHEAQQKEQQKTEANTRYERQRRYNARESAAWRHSKAIEQVTDDEINEELERMSHHGGD